MPPEKQGIAASLVATVVYYSQSIGLGIGGTVEVHERNGDLLKGYRGASYTGIGSTIAGLLTGGLLVLRSRKAAGSSVVGESDLKPETKEVAVKV